ncbi:MAG: hypothetical protein ACTS4T_00575 [Candidatus Hodgkinia cicadicola]
MNLGFNATEELMMTLSILARRNNSTSNGIKGSYEICLVSSQVSASLTAESDAFNKKGSLAPVISIKRRNYQYSLNYEFTCSRTNEFDFTDKETIIRLLNSEITCRSNERKLIMKRDKRS